MISFSLLELFGVDTSNSFLIPFEIPGLALAALTCSLLYVGFWLFVRYRKRVAIQFRWPTFLGCLAVGLIPYLANEATVASAYRQLGQLEILTRTMTLDRAHDVVCSFDQAKLAPGSLDGARLTLADKSLRWRKAQAAQVISSEEWAAQSDQCSYLPIPDTHQATKNLHAAGRAHVWLLVAISVFAAYGLWVLLTFSAASLGAGRGDDVSPDTATSNGTVVSKAEAIAMAIVGALLGGFFVLPFAHLLIRAKPTNR